MSANIIHQVRGYDELVRGKNHLEISLRGLNTTVCSRNYWHLLLRQLSQHSQQTSTTMYAIYGPSPVLVQPSSLNDYLNYQRWREEQAYLEEQRQYQLYRQMERQRQRQRMALAALEQHEKEQRRGKLQQQKYQQALDHRRLVNFLQQLHQQEQEKQIQQQRQEEAKRQRLIQQQMARQELARQLYWQQGDNEGDEDSDEWTDLVHSLMTKILQGNDDKHETMPTSDAVEPEQDSTDAKADVTLLMMTNDTPSAEGPMDEEDEEDSDDADETLLVLTDDAPITAAAKAMDEDDDADGLLTALTDDAPAASTNDDKKKLKLETLDEIKQQLEKIHESHQKVLASSLYFNDQQQQQQQHQHDTTTPADLVQVPTVSKNYEFLLYEDNIMRILLQLDNISSDGDETIRQQRKDLVKQAGLILDQLDHYKQAEWERHSSNSATSDDDDDVSDESDEEVNISHFDSMSTSNNNHNDSDNDDDIQDSDLDDGNHDDDMQDSDLDHDDASSQDFDLVDDIDDNGFLILNL